MKALVCGNAPCLTLETINKNLSDFFVVRMNGFVDFSNIIPCDAWSSWPDPTHRLKHKRCEPMYDVERYAADCKELWLVHPGFFTLALMHFKRMPNYVLPNKSVSELKSEVGSSPNMGMLMIQACLTQERFDEVFVAGFDFYESGNDYYFTKGKFEHPAHCQTDNKKWFLEQLELRKINLLGEI